MTAADDADLTARKAALRAQISAARRTLRPPELVESATAICARLLTAPELGRARTVAAYVSVGSEPGTGPLLEALHERGTRLLLPVLLPDGDLDWAPYAGPDALVSARRGLLEPTTPCLGSAAVGNVDAVLCPGLAADLLGHRLGRGGGSYDRALARVPSGTWQCVLLYDDEVLPAVPAGAADAAVDAAAIPSGIVRLG